jgi:IS5 family transposase
MGTFKKHRDYGFFDQDIRLSKLTKLGDPLVKLEAGVDFELFRTILMDGFTKLAKGPGGRPPYDYVLMFKILVLQKYYNLSDDQIEFQINDRMSFMRFLNLTISDDIPDSKTVWNFKEQLTGLELVEKLFDLFVNELAKLGLIINEGKIIDASFIEVPKQRNTKAENKEIKEGITPTSLGENPNKLAQKDMDARWTKKNNISYYGYKNHAKIDSKSKIIVKFTVTDASVHDSQQLDSLLDDKDKNKEIFADSAYVGQQETLQKRGVIDQIHEKGYKNKPLTEEQIESNKKKSKTRARVEHVFGFMEKNMNSMTIRTIGIKRATASIGLLNLVYNMFRKIQITSVNMG